MFQPSFKSCYAMAGGPRRIVTNMLLMPAFKVGNPVQAFVLMKGDDFTRDSGDFCSHGSISRPLPFYALLPPAGWAESTKFTMYPATTGSRRSGGQYPPFRLERAYPASPCQMMAWPFGCTGCGGTVVRTRRRW